VDFGLEYWDKKKKEKKSPPPSPAQINGKVLQGELLGKQVNGGGKFLKKQIANFMSECLIWCCGRFDVILLPTKQKIQRT